MIYSGADNPLCSNFKYQCSCSNINRHNATKSRWIIRKNTHYLLKVNYFYILRDHNLPCRWSNNNKKNRFKFIYSTMELYTETCKYHTNKILHAISVYLLLISWNCLHACFFCCCWCLGIVCILTFRPLMSLIEKFYWKFRGREREISTFLMKIKTDKQWSTYTCNLGLARKCF